jgi:hypothetical protein
VSSGVVLVAGAFFSLMSLWALNHEDAVGSSGMYTSWVSTRTRRALAWFVLVGGLAMTGWAALS